MPAFAPVDKPAAVASDELEAALLVFVPRVLVLAVVILVLLAEDVILEDGVLAVSFAAAQNSMYHADTSIRSDATVHDVSQLPSGVTSRVRSIGDEQKHASYTA